MFHQAIGGREYTGLPNIQQAWLDMSPLMKDRAILFAELDADSSAAWRFDDKPIEASDTSRTTFIRIVLPLESTQPSAAGGAP